MVQKNDIITIRGHHLWTLYRMINNPIKQFKMIADYHGLTLAQYVDEIVKLLPDIPLIKITATKDIFCAQCPTYSEKACCSNEILTDDYFGARMFSLKIDAVYTGKNIFGALSRKHFYIPPRCLDDKVKFVQWLDFLSEEYQG